MLNDLANDNPIKVFVQVNTSREEQKHGVALEDVEEVVRHIIYCCPNLHFCGLMTIGSAHSSLGGVGENADFASLANLKASISQSLNIPPEKIELSMGMSGDYQQAVTILHNACSPIFNNALKIRCGSTSVRVGSAIFGSRA